MTDSISAAENLTLTRAVRFAAEQHADQRRKGARAEPYFNHLAEVAAIVTEATGGRDAALIAAAFLHDVVEDTPATGTEVEDLFGADIAALVAHVSDDKSLEKAERKRRQIEKAPSLPSRAKQLKIADKISNLRSILTSPPDGWSEQRIVEYGHWAEAVVAGCMGVNAELDALFSQTTHQFWQRYGNSAS